jgi:hypothetical protein
MPVAVQKYVSISTRLLFFFHSPPPPSRTHWHKPCVASSAAARAESSRPTCTLQHPVPLAALTKNQGPASRVARNGSSFHQGLLHVFARFRDSRCRPMLSRSPCTRAGPVPAPPAIIQPIINRTHASAFHALHHVPRALAHPPPCLSPNGRQVLPQPRSRRRRLVHIRQKILRVLWSRRVRCRVSLHASVYASLYEPLGLTRRQVHALRILQVPRRLGRHRLQHAVYAVQQAGLGRA